ncbi:MAG: hypothetical protein BZY75_06605 [SAR202 cluster bacterium Io17-Chloro-G7]|nr:MAG: hypothetical protein BZY75_06605 [SAR202 cluster bacterium Io17-Chloro-G7]
MACPGSDSGNIPPHEEDAVPTLAVSTYTFGPEAQATEGLEFALKHGFGGLELGSYTLWPETISTNERGHVRSLAGDHGVELSIHFIHRGVAPASHQPERRSQHRIELEQTLDLANDIGARVVVVHPGPIDCPGVAPTRAPEAVRQEARENLRNFLAEIAPKAEATGVVVCVENLHHAPGQVIQSYAELLELVQQVSSPAVQITLDTGHADLSDGITDAIDTFALYLRHVHIHDCDGKRDHLEIGEGELDFTRWLDWLRHYPLTLVLETRNDADPQGSVLRSRDRLREIIGPLAR